jgi:hypothetical protein
MFVGGGLTLVTAAAGGLGAPRGIWIGAAIAGVVAFALAIRLHAHPETNAGASTDLVPPQHLQELRDRLTELMVEVNDEKVCDFDDPPERRQLNQEAIAAHFPTLIPKLEEWNRAVGANTCARNKLRTRLLPAVASADIGISGDEVEAIAESLADAHPQPILEGQWQLLSTGIGFFAADARSKMMVRLSQPTLRLAQDQFARLLAHVRAIQTEAREWREGRGLRAANQALETFSRDELLDELRAAQSRHSVRVSPDCPACADLLPGLSAGSVGQVPQLRGR